MSETISAKPPGLRSAAWVALALLLALAALLPLLAQDRDARHELEIVSGSTAVGDTAYLKHRTRGAPPEIYLHGKLLVPPSPRHLELRDSKMTFAGLEDGGVLRLYTTSETVPWEKGEAEVKGQPVFFMKVGENEYLRVQ